VFDPFSRLAQAFSDPERNCRQTVYIYRLAPSGKLIKPYLAKTEGLFDDDCALLGYLRDAQFGGDFRILIRDGSRMVFAGDVSIWRPLQRRLGFK
jgi:hypothetical protein